MTSIQPSSNSDRSNPGQIFNVIDAVKHTNNLKQAKITEMKTRVDKMKDAVEKQAKVLSELSMQKECIKASLENLPKNVQAFENIMPVRDNENDISQCVQYLKKLEEQGELLNDDTAEFRHKMRASLVELEAGFRYIEDCSERMKREIEAECLVLQNKTKDLNRHAAQLNNNIEKLQSQKFFLDSKYETLVKTRQLMQKASVNEGPQPRKHHLSCSDHQNPSIPRIALTSSPLPTKSLTLPVTKDPVPSDNRQKRVRKISETAVAKLPEMMKSNAAKSPPKSSALSPVEQMETDLLSSNSISTSSGESVQVLSPAKTPTPSPAAMVMSSGTAKVSLPKEPTTTAELTRSGATPPKVTTPVLTVSIANSSPPHFKPPFLLATMPTVKQNVVRLLQNGGDTAKTGAADQLDRSSPMSLSPSSTVDSSLFDADYMSFDTYLRKVAVMKESDKY